ncbi:MAG: hypothetical protein WA865_08795 [Spirulinaceae cyanobacterium]
MQKKYEVVIETLPNKHLPLLRIFRELGGWGLKEAKGLLAYTKKIWQRSLPVV